MIRVEDGVIICPDKKYEPTDEERIHIEAEIAAQIELKLWPHSITAHSADALRDMLPKDAVLYEYLTENGKEISFVQQRVVDDTLKKRDLPWSYWSDGHWRMMEPDTALPLWGLESCAMRPRYSFMKAPRARWCAVILIIGRITLGVMSSVAMALPTSGGPVARQTRTG